MAQMMNNLHLLPTPSSSSSSSSCSIVNCVFDPQIFGGHLKVRSNQSQAQLKTTKQSRLTLTASSQDIGTDATSTTRPQTQPSQVTHPLSILKLLLITIY